MNVRTRRFDAALGVFAALALLIAAGVLYAAKQPKKEDRFLHPQYASFQVRTIAVLPAATFYPDENAVAISRRSLEEVAAKLEPKVSQAFPPMPTPSSGADTTSAKK
jgi:hypothetical protein